MRAQTALAAVLAPILACVLAAPSPARAQQAPPPCPTAMGIVDRTVGPALVYLPADPSRPEACRMVLPGGAVGEFYYGAWKTDWPGADRALPAIRRVYAGGPGAEERFDTVVGPGYAWHETIRNEGFEDLNVAGRRRRTMKLAHEREGFDGNTYHSVITIWKDVETGMSIYQNYRHIAGRPEIGQAWDPRSIVGGR
jgi:hypothetical protein